MYLYDQINNIKRDAWNTVIDKNKDKPKVPPPPKSVPFPDNSKSWILYVQLLSILSFHSLKLLIWCYFLQVVLKLQKKHAKDIQNMYKS